MTIEWHAIRPWNGSKSGGFETLCAQLADLEKPAGSRFFRKGTPDAGVECFAILPDGNEWGWQAKFFDSLESSQWTQLNDSVKTALAKHPCLTRYFICIPINRPDARVKGRKSALEQWEHHVQKWRGWASKRQMNVEFVYWGDHELLERLSQPKQSGRLKFWFDVRRFDNAWFTDRLEESLRSAGERYTPELHVGLPIADEFQSFGRTLRFANTVKSEARLIRDKDRLLSYTGREAKHESLEELTGQLSSQIQNIYIAFAELGVEPVGLLPFERMVQDLVSAQKTATELGAALQKCEDEYSAKNPHSDGARKDYYNQTNPFRRRRYYLDDLSYQLDSTRGVLLHAEELAGSQLMLVTGDAGVGKTHLLCDVAKCRLSEGQPTVLLMGQCFLTEDPPWTQALRHVDLADYSAEDFVGALEAAAQAANCRALVMIDAINEGAGMSIWPSHLSAFLAILERSPWIGVVLSVRSSYEAALLPEKVLERATKVYHRGFQEHEYDAVRIFFKAYGLELPSTPLLTPEFSNPLFLKTLCKGLNENGETRLPRGFHGITAVFRLYLDAVNRRLARSNELDYDPKRDLVHGALNSFAEACSEGLAFSLSRSEAQRVIDAHLPGREFSRSLFHALIAEGLLSENLVRRQNGTYEEIVHIAYNRLADHLLANALLDEHLSPEGPEAAFAPGAPLSLLWDERRPFMSGLLEALCIQVPERTKHELAVLAPGVLETWGIGDAFRLSIVWRSFDAFSDETGRLLNKLTRNKYENDSTLDTLLTVSVIPGHPYNALWLDRKLRKDTVPGVSKVQLTDWLIGRALCRGTRFSTTNLSTSAPLYWLGCSRLRIGFCVIEQRRRSFAC
ncbi:MAG: hypothetical protein WC655_11015 [Candidatus Hydrogenedentales bacterium]|jgi:hypothetical protein